MEGKKLLTTCLGELNIEIEDVQIEQLLEFMEYLLETNKNINLTSITDRKDFILKHIVDSLVMLGKSDVFHSIEILDVGTGGGFPGIPLKILFPQIEISLMDSVEKKLKFIDKAVERLGIHINLIHDRAENLGRNINNREKYDIVISRAVANMQTLSEYCLPLVRIGGIMLASKGPKAQEEIALAQQAIKILGGKVQSVNHLTIPIALLERNIITIKKVHPTPKKYPRKPGIPNKNPL